MSAIDQDELLYARLFDSGLPGISSVDSTIELGVNVSSPSANQPDVRAMYFGDSMQCNGPSPQ